MSDEVSCAPGQVMPGASCCVRGVLSLMPDFELPPPGPDGKIWLTTAQAAAAAHVKPCTITTWKARGLIAPHPESPPRRPVYEYGQLLEAEHKMRRKAIEDGHEYWAQRRPGLRSPRGQVA